MFVNVVIPVYNEAPLIRLNSYRLSGGSELHGHVFSYIIVDDGSTKPHAGADFRFETNQGYGAALKKGIELSHTKYVITMDGDGQHEIEDVVRLVDFVERFPECAMVVGDRRVQEQRIVRWAGRKFLNWMASLFALRWIPDLNSGLRIFRRDVVIGYLPILCDKFSFTTSLTLALLSDGYKVDWLPIRVLERRRGRSHVKVWSDGWRTLWYILWIGGALRTRGVRRVWRSLHR